MPKAQRKRCLARPRNVAGASVQAIAELSKRTLVALHLDADGEVLVLGQRVGRKAAHRLQHAICATRRPRPGTTVSVPSAASARRSRFCATMYSSACQRVIMLMRLPTLALPATAPISGSANQRTRRAIVSRWNCVSASSATMMSPRRSREADVQRVRLAAIRHADQRDALIAAERSLQNRRRAVLRAVVDDDDFEIVMIAAEDALDRLRDHLLFVVGRE